MFRSLYVVLLACLTLWVEGQDLCCLCNNCDFPVRPNYKVDSAGTTCASIDLKMGNPFQTPKGSAQCSSMYQKYHNMCCNDSYNPPQVAQQAPADELGPEDIKWDGPYQRCNICKDNSTPRYTSMVVSSLYINNEQPQTCTSLWKAALRGDIQTYLCPALQYNCWNACGCGDPRPAAP